VQYAFAQAFIFFRLYGEISARLKQPSSDEDKNFTNFFLMQSGGPRNFPDADENIKIQQDVKPLMQKKPWYLRVFSAMIQSFPTSCPGSQEADATRPLCHLDRGKGHDVKGEYPNGYEFRKY
jgi:hypothetical protein